MERVCIKLNSDRATKRAIRKRLTRKKNAKRFKLVDKLKAAEMVVASTDDLKSLPKKLPSNVKLLQLTDCGGAQRYRDARDLKIANATRLFERPIALSTLGILRFAVADVLRSTGKLSLQLGIVGFGNIGQECQAALGKALEIPEIREILALDSIVINDLRTATEDHARRMRDTFDPFGISHRSDDLDETLMSSDIVIVAVHRGPTADPLLGTLEAGLIDANSWVIDLSEEGVVDRPAFVPKHHGEPLPELVCLNDFSESIKENFGIGLDLPPKKVARFIEWNLKETAKGRDVYQVRIPGAPTSR